MVSQDQQYALYSYPHISMSPLTSRMPVCHEMVPHKHIPQSVMTAQPPDTDISQYLNFYPYQALTALSLLPASVFLSLYSMILTISSESALTLYVSPMSSLSYIDFSTLYVFSLSFTSHVTSYSTDFFLSLSLSVSWGSGYSGVFPPPSCRTSTAILYNNTSSCI